MKKLIIALLLIFSICNAHDTLYHSVNVITGEYCEAEVDLTLGPLTIKRVYSSGSPQGEWLFNLPHFLTVNPTGIENTSLNYVFDENQVLQSVSTPSGWLEIRHGENCCEIQSHQGKNIGYHTHLESGGRFGNTYLIDKVTSGDQTLCEYTYAPHPTERKKVLTQRFLPNGRYLINDYYKSFDPDVDPAWHQLQTGKVKQQLAPAGTDAAPVAIARYVYGMGYTEVYDALNNKMVYRYSDDDYLLTAIESYQGNELYRQEKLFYQNKKLRSRAVIDGTDCIENCMTYEYDDQGNQIRRTLYGNLSGKNSTPILLDEQGMPFENGVESFSQWFFYSGSLLLKEGNDSGTEKRYVYNPVTEQIVASYTCDVSGIRLRSFFQYNDEGQLIEIINDDGSSEDSANLNGVSKRKVIKQTLIEEVDSVDYGQPSIIDEYFIDIAANQENLLKRTVNSYDETGKLIQQDFFDGDLKFQDSRQFQYDESGKPITDGKNGNRDYDLNGNLIAKSDESSHSTFRYDLMNRLIGKEEWQEDGFIQSELYRYNIAGDRTSKIDTFGNATHYEYDAFHRLVSVTFPEVKDEEGSPCTLTMCYGYDICNRCTLITDSKEETTKKAYNARNQPIEITHPDGTKEYFEYHLDGTLAKTKDAKGITTSYFYDFLKRKTCEKVFDSSGKLDHESLYSYNGFQLTSSTDAEGKTTIICYNDAGQLISTIQDEGEIKEYLYDKLGGSLIGIKEWFGDGADEYRVCYTEQDENHELKEVRLEDAKGRLFRQMTATTSSEKNALHYHMDYINDLGQNVLKVSKTNDKGITTVWIYDAIGREDCVLTLDPLWQPIHKKQFFYDGSHNKTRETETVLTPDGDSFAFAIAWQWGPNHRLVKLTEANATANEQSTQYAYNSKGLLESIQKADGRELFYGYDAMARLHHIHSSDHSIDYRVTYDSQGRIVEVFDAIQKTTHSLIYDNAGHLIEEELGNGLTVQNEFDRLGRRTQLILPDESSIVYEYDAAYLRAVHRYNADQEKCYTHTYTEFDQSGFLLSEKLIHSVGTRDFIRDKQGRPLEIITPYWNQALNEYDASGNLLQMSYEDSLGSETTQFSFDEQNQIIDEKGMHYQYDTLMNRCSKNEDLYEIDASNQLLSTEDAQYTYDSNGNLIQKQMLHHHYAYSYDALNRLTDVTIDEAQTIHYTYDLFNRRLTKTKEGETTCFLYDGDCEIGAVNAKGELTQLRVLGIGRGAEIGAAIAIELEGSVFAPIHDHLGSVRCLVDCESETVKEFYRFTAYGEEQIFGENGESLEASLNPWRFFSKRTEEETGFVFFGKRYYDPDSGRWISKDPLYFIDGPNRYVFALNNPLKNQDLYGHFSFSDTWDTLWNHLVESYNSLYTITNEGLYVIQDELDYFNRLRVTIDVFSQELVGTAIFILTGFDAGESETGVYGEGEINNNVRITWINGILNVRPYFFESVKMLSETHDGINIHYIFKPTEGWGRDLIAGLLSILGFTSPHAKSLTKTWKELIEEMGGVDGDGLIIHYAHSIGGTETFAALNLLTPEERRKIRVITFGSATMISDHGLSGATNYVSRRDGVGLLGMLRGMVFGDSNVHCVGSVFGFPFIDHTVGQQTYSQIIEELGKQFANQWGRI